MNMMTEEQAQKYLEQLRWPTGPQCPHCKLHQVTRIKGKRARWFQCNRCRKQFSVTVGTIFERSHVPLNKWVMAFQWLCTSKKGISALQIARMLGVSYKTAWFMCHRIRHAMKRTNAPMMTGIVEIDETYVGGKENSPVGRSTKKKTPVVAVIQRNGDARTRVVKSVTAKNLKKVLTDNVDIESRIMSDDFMSYRHLDEVFADHQAVKHGKKEYVRGEAHVNTCESFFSLLKRGVVGSFHHVSREHLHRYADEFSFRWNTRRGTDGERTAVALQLADGKRLMYRTLTNEKTAKN